MPYLPKNLAFLAALTSLTTSLAVLPTLATAQQSAVDEVIVTGAYRATTANALKMPIPLIDVPQSLSIIGQDEIKLRGYDELGDIVRYTPGVNTSQGEGHRDSIVFRGVRSTADFFLDGVRDDVQYYLSLIHISEPTRPY